MLKMVYTEIEPYKLGSRWFSRNGHYYVVTRTRGASLSLRCVSNKCPVRWMLRNERAGRLTGEHDHPPTPWIPHRNAMFQALKRRAASETTALSAIYEQEASRYPDAAPHLLWENVYPSMRKWRQSVNGRSFEYQVDDDHSNSSVKFSSEILGQFEQHGEVVRCTVCQKTTDNSIEDMKSHLEMDHPAVLVNILSEKTNAESTMAYEEVHEDAVDEETFTEVVYLEEEPKPTKTPLKRARSKPFKDQSPRIKIKKEFLEQTAVATPPAPIAEKTDLDTFLNYIGVLIKKVPKESLPKLELDVICLILNAQNATAPNTVDASKGPVRASMSNSGNYQITIQNADESGQGD